MGKGLVMVFTGDGKGKTTAALGLALRSVGHGFPTLIIQFIKGGWRTGESLVAERLAPELTIIPTGLGFTEATGRKSKHSREDHTAASQGALALAREAILSRVYRLVILDEALYALHDGLISLEDLISIIDSKPHDLHLVLTGRDAPPEIVEMADLVTEMRLVKHPIERGITAQKGIEY